MFSTIISAIRLALGLSILSTLNMFHFVKNLYWTIYTQIWDVNLHLANIFTPELDPKRVIAQGKPGANGDWSRFTYLPPTENDSRSPCPALNALCNHGIMPRDGRNLKFTDFAKILNETYNLSPSLCMSILMSIARLYGLDYFTDSVDLELFNTHNVIEHDASLIRHDSIIQPDQSKPAVDLINMLLRFATGAAIVNKQRVRVLTPADIAAFSRQRRQDCKAHNPQFSLKFLHKFFSANNNAIMYDTFAGRVDDLKVWLTEERFPQGWQPRYNKRYGYTLLALNWRTIQIAIWTEPPPFVSPPRRPVSNGLYSE